MDSQTGEANDRRKNLGHACRFLDATQRAYAGYVALPRRSKDGQGMVLTRTNSSFGLYVKHNITDPLVHMNHPSFGCLSATLSLAKLAAELAGRAGVYTCAK